jgi:hypothetical protein
LRARLGAEARRTIVERFDARTSATQLAALFAERTEDSIATRTPVD